MNRERVTLVREQAKRVGHPDKWLFVALCDALLAEPLGGAAGSGEANVGEAPAVKGQTPAWEHSGSAATHPEIASNQPATVPPSPPRVERWAVLNYNRVVMVRHENEAIYARRDFAEDAVRQMGPRHPAQPVSIVHLVELREGEEISKAAHNDEAVVTIADLRAQLAKMTDRAEHQSERGLAWDAVFDALHAGNPNTFGLSGRSGMDNAVHEIRRLQSAAALKAAEVEGQVQAVESGNVITVHLDAPAVGLFNQRVAVRRKAK